MLRQVTLAREADEQREGSGCEGRMDDVIVGSCTGICRRVKE